MAPLIELAIRRSPDGTLTAELRAFQRNSVTLLAPAQPVTISAEALRGLSVLPDAYGAALSAMVFPAVLREAWQRARGAGEVAGSGMQLRVLLDDPTGELHALRWELLHDPATGTALAQQEGGSLARLVPSDSLHDPVLPARPALRALVAVAGPADASAWGLDPVDGVTEAERALTALGDIPADLLADGHDRSRGLTTLANLLDGLRGGAQVLYLICHGKATEAGTVLYLVGDDGRAAPITGDELTAELRALDPAHRPLLAVLVACEGGSQEQAPLAAVGPLLAATGIPAVVAMQALITMGAAAQFTGRLLRELRRDGRVDRALAAARREMGEAWWVPVLWLRSRDGRLWEEEGATPAPSRQDRLRALLHDHSGFIASRMEAFVGREAELAEIRTRIAEKLPTGGYVTITGQAGQGKSSVIARLVADTLGDGTALRERLLEPGAGVPVCHFIPFSPGPDHQVGLLRNLIARLCLTYGLPDFYAATDSRPALRDYFAVALRDLAKQGKQEVIYIDGLDQIEEDASGVRDLSFLPEEPPEGIVFVLGTRPNDTLKPLELRKPQHEYWLPPLSRNDFDLILQHRGVTLDTILTDRFYAAMQENALYLDLVARELAQADAIEPEQIIARVADNPANLFSLSIERLQRNERQWESVLRPILGLLLAARAPLSQRALHALIGADKLRARRGLERLGGLIQRDGEGRYGLFHLKLGEYLRQDVFANDEEESYHQQLMDWCEGGKGGISAIWADQPDDVLEQERRAYARHHFIAHLAAARSYKRLWEVIDAGEYGREKRRHDPSTRSYVLDLDIARQAVIDAAAGDADAQAQALPRLWRYSLLRCSLTRQIDNYPEELFPTLVALGQSNEATNLAELLSDLTKKTRVLQVISVALLARGIGEGINVLQRARITADAIPDERQRVTALRTLVAALAQAEQFPLARATADAIPDDFLGVRVEALGALAAALAQAGRTHEANIIFAQAHTTAHGIPHDPMSSRAEALGALAAALAQAGRTHEANIIFAQARATADAIPRDSSRAEALSALVAALAQAGQFPQARATADAIPAGYGRSKALRILATALAQAEQFPQARATVDTIPYHRPSARDLAALAAALAQAGRAQEADTIFAEAHAKAAVMLDPLARAHALSALAAALAQVGRTHEANTTFAQARACAGTIPDRDARPKALGTLAIAFAQAGQFRMVRATVDAIPIEDWRVKDLTTLAAALVQVGQFRMARATVDAIPFETLRSEGLETLAIVFAQAGQFRRARATARAIPSRTYRARALSILASALAQAGQFRGAPATTDITLGADARAETLSALADTTQLDRGLRREPSDARAETLSALADTLAQAGLLPQGVSLLADLWRRAQTRDELLSLFIVPPELLRAYPELGQAFLDSFAWVDAQLAAS